MAEASLADFTSFRNQQIQINEQMADCLWNIEALMAVVLTTNNFFELTTSTMHSYFSVVADLVEETIQINQSILVNLHKK